MRSEGKIAKVPDPLAAQIGNHVLSFRALNGKRRNIRLENPNVHSTRTGDPGGPKLDVTVCDGEPDLVLGDLQQHRIVDEHTLVIADRCIFALTDLQTVKVPRRQIARQRQRIRSLQRNLPFDRNVPHRDTVDQPLILGSRIAVTGRHVHVVIDAGCREPGGARRLEIGALADAWPDGQGNRHNTTSHLANGCSLRRFSRIYIPVSSPGCPVQAKNPFTSSTKRSTSSARQSRCVTRRICGASRLIRIPVFLRCV